MLRLLHLFVIAHAEVVNKERLARRKASNCAKKRAVFSCNIGIFIYSSGSYFKFINVLELCGVWATYMHEPIEFIATGDDDFQRI